MPQLQPEPARPEPTEHHVFKARPHGDAEPDPTDAHAVGSAGLVDAKGVGDGGPPPPPANDATHSHFVVWLKAAIHAAGERAARIRYRVILLLVFLVAIAAAAVVAGMLAKSDTFWAASALAFSAAFCGLVAYAAKELGVFAETADLLSRSGKEGTHAAEPSSSPEKAPDEQELRTKIRGELAFEIARKVRDLSVDAVPFGTDTALQGLVRAEQRIVHIGAEARHAPSARRLGQLHLGDAMIRDVVLAEEALVKAAKWGDPAAAYILGCWHNKGADLAHGTDWWLAHAKDGSELAAYLAARALKDSDLSEIESLPALASRNADEALSSDALPPLVLLQWALSI